MGSGEVIAALEAVREAVDAGRERVRAAAETYGDMFAVLSSAFDGSASGERDPATGDLDPRYVAGVKLARRLGLVTRKAKLAAAGDVELTWAWRMREQNVKRSRLAINNPKGPCQGDLSCDRLLPTWLAPYAELTVHWRDERGRDRSKTYVGALDEH